MGWWRSWTQDICFLTLCKQAKSPGHWLERVVPFPCEELRFMLSPRVSEGARCAMQTLLAKAGYPMTQSSFILLKADVRRNSSQRDTQVLAQLSLHFQTQTHTILLTFYLRGLFVAVTCHTPLYISMVSAISMGRSKSMVSATWCRGHGTAPERVTGLHKRHAHSQLPSEHHGWYEQMCTAAAKKTLTWNYVGPVPIFLWASSKWYFNIQSQYAGAPEGACFSWPLQTNNREKERGEIFPPFAGSAPVGMRKEEKESVIYTEIFQAVPAENPDLNAW